MKDILQDLVTHTHALGFLPVIKVSGSITETVIESMSESRSVIVTAKTHKPVVEFEGTFGMPNLDKLNIHLKCPEYKEDAKIDVVRVQRNGQDIPATIHFENFTGDFSNEYRFMSAEVINEKLKSVKFKGAAWDIEFEPAVASIQRLKYQSQAHSEEPNFQVKTEDGNLIFSFGDASTHAGSFVFQTPAGGKLKSVWSWPVTEVMSILGLSGDKTMKFSDAGAMMITVDSGLAEYNYILPAQSK